MTQGFCFANIVKQAKGTLSPRAMLSGRQARMRVVLMMSETFACADIFCLKMLTILKDKGGGNNTRHIGVAFERAFDQRTNQRP